MRRGHTSYLLNLVLLFTVYFATAKFGLNIDAVSGFATLVWPPTGIALAGILILGYRYWPGISLAAFFVNFTTGAPWWVAAGIALGNTLEPVLGAYWLKRVVGFENPLERLKDVFGLVMIAAVLATLISATIGVTSLWLGDVISFSSYGATWTAWWVGDMLGALVVAPLLLVWSQPVRTFRSELLIEILVLAFLLTGVSILVFQGYPNIGVQPFTFVYILFPILIAIALRFGQRGGTMATFIVSLIAVWNAVDRSSEVVDADLSQNLLLLQSFMGITAVTFMTMAAVVAEREQTQKRQQQLALTAKTLTKQRSRLMALNQAKDEFIAMASHQLRTPASGVKQYIGMLLENYAGKLTKHQRHIVRLAYKSNERQIQVVDDLLNVAQIDAGKVRLSKEKVDVAQLITDILREQKSVFSARKQVINLKHANRTFIALADRTKLRMVLENIISNASKYTFEGKEIEIRLKRDKSNLAISIKDNGIGISKKDLKKLFKKFSRIDNSLSVTVGGTGLGLYWAKKMIDLHRGSITVTSKLDEGSVFTVMLPVEKG